MENTKYVRENIKIRQVLHDIIDEAYKTKSEEERVRYKKFWIELSDKNIKSRAGQYNGKKRTIEITGMDRNEKHIVVTCIHELTHHIDNCNRGHSDHSSEFYAVYRELLYAALNMKIFDVATLQCITDVTDGKKIKKIADEWTPEYVEYRNDICVIVVSNCFKQKDVLKAREYKYNTVGRTWEKEIKKDEVEYERGYLNGIEIKNEDIEIKDANDIQVKVKGKIIAGKGSYDFRNELKENGFYYKDKKWEKVTEGNIKDEIHKYQQLLPQVEFTYRI